MKNLPSWIMLVLFVLLLGSLSSGTAQAEAFDIDVELLDCDGVGIDNIKVTIESNDNKYDGWTDDGYVTITVQVENPVSDRITLILPGGLDGDMCLNYCCAYRIFVFINDFTLTVDNRYQLDPGLQCCGYGAMDEMCSHTPAGSTITVETNYYSSGN